MVKKKILIILLSLIVLFAGYNIANYIYLNTPTKIDDEFLDFVIATDWTDESVLLEKGFEKQTDNEDVYFFLDYQDDDFIGTFYVTLEQPTKTGTFIYKDISYSSLIETKCSLFERVILGKQDGYYSYEIYKDNTIVSFRGYKGLRRCR